MSCASPALQFTTVDRHSITRFLYRALNDQVRSEGPRKIYQALASWVRNNPVVVATPALTAEMTKARVIMLLRWLVDVALGRAGVYWFYGLGYFKVFDLGR